MKLVTNNEVLVSSSLWIIYAQKTEIALVKVWATNSDDWMDILKVTTHIIVFFYFLFFLFYFILFYFIL